MAKVGGDTFLNWVPGEDLGTWVLSISCLKNPCRVYIMKESIYNYEIIKITIYIFRDDQHFEDYIRPFSCSSLAMLHHAIYLDLH